MEEDRSQSYINLIGQLLSCDNQEDFSQTLNDNQNLLDGNLLETLEQIIPLLREQAREEEAQRCENLAQGLKQMLAGESGNPQPYLDLIRQLLECPSGEEANILQANTELIDATLVEVMKRVTANMRAAGDENNANFLENMIRVIELSLNQEDVNREDYQAFLLEVLQAEYESNSNTEVVYPILQRNLDKLNPYFAQFLGGWANYFAQNNPEDSSAVAILIENLSIHIINFPYGNPANNLQIAITGFEAVLEVRTAESSPVNRAKTLNNLGNAHRNQAQLGIDPNQNLERAITAYEEAVIIFRQPGLEKDLSGTLTNLGFAQQTQAELGIDPDQNLERAIAAYKEAVTIRRQPGLERDLSSTLNNLGNAHLTQAQLGIDPNQNLERAIAAYEEAVIIFRQPGLERDLSGTLNNLGAAQLTQAKLGIDPNQNLEKAIAAYEEAVIIRRQPGLERELSQTLTNLGTAQLTQAELGIDPNQNLERAIAVYDKAVRIRRQPGLERYLSETLNNLGIAHRNQAQLGIDPNQNLERAIAAYRESLNFLKPDILPSECLRTARNLGNLAFVQGWWEIAVEGYSQGIEAVEQTRLWVTTEKSKQEIQEQAKEIYARIVHSLIELKQYAQALEYVERSKARNLVELLATKDLYPKGDIPETILKELDRLRKEVRIEQRRLGAKNNNPQSDAKVIENGTISSRLPQLQQELDRLIKEHIQPVDPTFALSQKVTPISLEEIQSLIPNDSTAIVQWYFSDNDIYAFIITRNPGQPVLIHIAPNLEILQNLAEEYLQDYFNSKDPDKTKWKTELQNRMQRMREILGIDNIKGKIAKLVPNCQRLFLVPYRYLHIFPLHALFDIEDFPQGISYTPSCQIQKTIKPPEDNNLEPFLAIQNPTEDLAYTDLEVDTIRQNHFPDHQNTVLLGLECTKDSVLDDDLALRQCLHFSCHGYFNLDRPMESALLLAECEINSPPPELDSLRYLPLGNGSVVDLERCLTVKEIFELDLRQCRMAVLSACETGFSDIRSSTDEYVGLPSAFLFAGTRTVVSSLWAVSDLATALLMVRFYELLKDTKNPSTYLCPRVSLHQAQIWLRDSTTGELTDWVHRMPLSGSVLSLLAYLSTMDGEVPPFSQPQFWAAFCAIGF